MPERKGSYLILSLSLPLVLILGIAVPASPRGKAVSSKRAATISIPYPGLPTYPGRIVILLKGVIGLENPHPEMPPPKTRVLTPKAPPSGHIPAHIAFVRWRKGELEPDGNTTGKVEWPVADVEWPHTKYEYVALDRGERLEIEDEDTTEQLIYDHYGDPASDTSLYWVTHFGKICKQRKLAPTNFELMAIEHGTLGSAIRMDIWTIANYNDASQSQEIEIAPAAILRMKPADSAKKTFQIRILKGTEDRGALMFRWDKHPVEILTIRPGRADGEEAQPEEI